MPSDWKKLTVPLLKEELKQRNLPVSGKKADLISRLEEYELRNSGQVAASALSPPQQVPLQAPQLAAPAATFLPPQPIEQAVRQYAELAAAQTAVQPQQQQLPTDFTKLPLDEPTAELVGTTVNNAPTLEPIEPAHSREEPAVPANVHTMVEPISLPPTDADAEHMPQQEAPAVAESVEPMVDAVSLPPTVDVSHPDSLHVQAPPVETAIDNLPNDSGAEPEAAAVAGLAGGSHDNDTDNKQEHPLLGGADSTVGDMEEDIVQAIPTDGVSQPESPHVQTPPVETAIDTLPDDSGAQPEAAAVAGLAGGSQDNDADNKQEHPLLGGADSTVEDMEEDVAQAILTETTDTTVLTPADIASTIEPEDRTGEAEPHEPGDNLEPGTRKTDEPEPQAAPAQDGGLEHKVVDSDAGAGGVEDVLDYGEDDDKEGTISIEEAFKEPAPISPSDKRVEEPDAPAPAPAATHSGEEQPDRRTDERKRKHAPIPLFKPRGRQELDRQESAGPKPAKLPKLTTEAPSADQIVSTGPPEVRTVPRPTEKKTRALKIENFVRPFTTHQVEELLGQTGKVIAFWMPTIKTHCYVIFETEAEAEATREATYGLQWPKGSGKKLVPTYVSVEEAETFTNPNSVQPKAAKPTERLAPSRPTANPVVSETPKSEPMKRVQKEEPKNRREQLEARKPKNDPPPPTLDDLFRKTQAKPHLYWLPLTLEQVQEKKKKQEAPQRQENGSTDKRPSKANAK